MEVEKPRRAAQQVPAEPVAPHEDEDEDENEDEDEDENEAQSETEPLGDDEARVVWCCRDCNCPLHAPVEIRWLHTCPNNPEHRPTTRIMLFDSTAPLKNDPLVYEDGDEPTIVMGGRFLRADPISGEPVEVREANDPDALLWEFLYEQHDAIKQGQWFFEITSGDQVKTLKVTAEGEPFDLNWFEFKISARRTWDAFWNCCTVFRAIVSRPFRRCKRLLRK